MHLHPPDGKYVDTTCGNLRDLIAANGHNGCTLVLSARELRRRAELKTTADNISDDGS